MSILSIIGLCVSMLFLGYSLGYFQGTTDLYKIIDTYKETINIYRKQLGLK